MAFFERMINYAIIKAMTRSGEKTLKQMDEIEKQARKNNDELLMSLLRENASTEYGRKYDFANIHSVDEYRQRVPFSDYTDYAPYIERMTQDGDSNLLQANKPVQYAQTSGSIGAPKYIPVGEKATAIYTKYSLARILASADEYCMQTKGRHLKPGKIMNTLECPTDIATMQDGTPRGNISGIVCKKFKNFFKYLLTSPIPVLIPQEAMDIKYCKLRFALEEKDLLLFISAFMSNISDLLLYLQKNWELLCDDIENGTINEKVEMSDKARESLAPYVKAHPERAAELRKEFQKGFDNTIMERIWPNLSCIAAIGTGGFSGYTKRVKQFCGSIPVDYMVYAASEGLMASVRHVEEPKYHLLPNGVFMEFLPADASEDETQTLLMDELEVGKFYEVILTNLSGFYRYRILDVVQVLGYENDCPIITFAYRKKQMLNLIGEKTSEEHLMAALDEFGEQLDIDVQEYVASAEDTCEPGKYVLILETTPRLDPGKTEEYANRIDKILRAKSYEYEEARSLNEIARCEVLVQQPETHLLWRDLRLFHGASNNQVKPVRLLDSLNKKKFFVGLVEQ